jgi:acetylornithine deacetylase/succinyl-diaminopimelate desuccinylase-like protein
MTQSFDLTADVSKLRAKVAGLSRELRADLELLVRIPSVSVDDFDQSHVEASAEATATLLLGAGLPDVRVVRVEGGRPAVIARRPAPHGAPTVLLYAHHDVQPPGPEAEWTSPAYEPTERDGRLYGRGAADDKAGIVAHLAALRAFDGNPPVGVIVFVEGEEEIGSPTLGTFLDTYKDALRADVIVLADSGNWAVGIPALTTSLRGLVDCYVEVSTLEYGVHSGMYGGVVPDALTCLCRLIATLHDADGNVAIEGLGSSPSDPLDLTEDRIRAEAGVLDGVRLIGTGPLTERTWTKPAVSVIGLDAPSTARASNTLLPTARAKVSLRVAPGDDANGAMAALEKHLLRHAPWGARVTVIPGEVGQPYAINATGPRYDAARAAFAAAWGRDPVEVGIGGSIPFVAEFAEAFPDAAILVTGVEDPDARAHGADESLHLAEFEKACLAEALLLSTLSRLA